MSELAVFNEPVIVLAAAMGSVLMASHAAMDAAFACLGSCAVRDVPPPQDLEPEKRR
jgi:hypothetical protein